MRRDRTLTRLLAVLAALLLVVAAACSSDDGDDAKVVDDTTTEASGDDSPTTEADDTTTAGDDVEVTLADLEQILPSQGDLGPEWSEQPPDDGSDDSFGDALDEQCPAATEIGGDDEDEDERAERSFIDDGGREVEVGLGVDAEEVDPDELTSLIAAINECPAITMGDGRFNRSATLQAEEVSGLGDQAVRMEVVVETSGEELSEPVVLTVHLLTFRRGEQGVTLQGQDGIDESTLQVHPFDTDLLDQLAAQLEADLAELTDG